MSDQYDLFVIGTGSAATTAADQCRQAGWKVGIADSREFGGTCGLRGCDPKKVLVEAARVVDGTERYGDRGIATSSIRLDWHKLQSFKRSFTEPMPGQIEGWLGSAGIDAFHGKVQFTSPQTLRVGDSEIEAKHILIATGAVPARLGIPGEEYLATSEDFLNWDEMPERVVFVGGGYISLEFAHVALRAGAEVTVLHRDGRPLGGFDPELVAQLLNESGHRGLAMHLDTEVTGIRHEGHEFVVEAVQGDRRREFVADAILHGGGRVPDLDGLDLDAGHVDYQRHGVRVNEYLQSVSNPHVYAAGDAAASPGLPLTPVAVMEGHVAADNLLGARSRTADYRAIPTVVYTIPPLAAVGLTESAAREAGHRIRVTRQETTDWYSSRHQLAWTSGFTVVVDEVTDQVLGAHVLGPHAEELINIFALAMRAQIPAAVLRQQPFAYPTGSSDVTYML